MADLKISEMPAATAFTGAEKIPVVQSGSNKAATPSQFLGGLNVKIVNIGDWNMDSSGQVTVAHGLGANFSKIRLVTAEIINDAGTATYTLISCFTNVGLSSNVTGAIESKDSTNISLTRVQGGFFDSTDFNSTGYNRGWVTIFYTD